MKTRVISATVLIILVVACFALGPVTRALFLLAAMIMAVWETCRAIGYKNVVCQPWILYAYCVATVAELWFNADALAFEITFFLAVFAAMTAGIVSKKIRGAGALATLGVLAYPIVPFVIVCKLALMESSVWIPVFAIACISTWVCDSFALFGGKRFGKHKIAPSVSPNKTVEGCICGAISSVVTGVIVYYLSQLWLPIPFWLCVVTALLASTMGQIGDLAESLVKRMIGVKDFSNLIPGHGGMFDRADSLLFSIPTAYLCLTVAGIIA